MSAAKMTVSVEELKVLLPELAGRVLVAGAGVSGVGITQLLREMGCAVTVADSNSAQLDKLAQQTGCQIISPADVVSDGFQDYTVVVTSPGWRPDSPLLVAAQSAGLEVIGDVELVYRLDRAEVFGPKRTWMVVTGTNGKTTTTAMLAEIMQHSGARAAAVGNIGVSVADAVSTQPRIDVLVAELSSFQLHWSSTLIPDVGILLNLADDHIDWHGSFAQYAQDKAKVLAAPTAIAGFDNEHVTTEMRRIQRAEDADPIIGFTLGEPAKGMVGVRDGQLFDCAFGDNVVLRSAEGIEPAGPAGLNDALAAAAAARSMGVSAICVEEALSKFEVAGHRGQCVGRHREVVAIDNSKATNPHAADSALAGFSSVVWVAGGQLKGAEIDELIVRHAGRIKAVALLGVDRDVIEDSVRTHIPGIPVLSVSETDPRRAMDEAVAWSVSQAEAGDAIVLAPAAASLDMYTGMGQRGDMFATAIAQYLHD